MMARKRTPAYWRMPRTMTQSALICTAEKRVCPCQAKVRMQQYIGILVALAAYYLVYERAHLLCALLTGVYKIQFACNNKICYTRKKMRGGRL